MANAGVGHALAAEPAVALVDQEKGEVEVPSALVAGQVDVVL